MEVLLLKKEHLEECAKIYVSTFNGPPWHDQWTEEKAYDRLVEIYKTPGFTGFVAVEAGSIYGAVLGNVETWFEGNMYNLKEMFVKEYDKGKGIGSRLLKDLEEELGKDGVTSISLFTSKGDLTEKFDKKNGYKIDAEMVMMCKDL